jgi:hypothetical protein
MVMRGRGGQDVKDGIRIRRRSRIERKGTYELTYEYIT